jgi:hypothetical protein
MAQVSLGTTNPEVAPLSFTKEVKEEVALIFERSLDESKVYYLLF